MYCEKFPQLKTSKVEFAVRVNFFLQNTPSYMFDRVLNSVCSSRNQNYDRSPDSGHQNNFEDQKLQLSGQSEFIPYILNIETMSLQNCFGFLNLDFG